MKGQDHEADAKKKSGGESYQENPTAQWKEVFQNVRRDFSHSYLPNAVIALICLLVGPSVGVIMKSPKIILVSAVIGLTLALWFAGYFIYKRIPDAVEPDQPRNLPPPTPSPLVSPSPSPEAPKGTPSPVSSAYDPKFLDWTFYTFDSFYGAIWQWKYRPHIEEMVPRDIRGSCPECEGPLRDLGGRTFDSHGVNYAMFLCPNHPLKTYHVPSDDDGYDGIRKLIQAKLHSGEWRQVVLRQLNAPG